MPTRTIRWKKPRFARSIITSSGPALPVLRRVLDIGCGWGAVLRRMVETHGVAHATGLTLSDAQADWIMGRGDPRIEVRRESWVDHSPAETYDAVLSIAAFEAFARNDWTAAEKVAAYRLFFSRCHDWLKPGGGLSLQTIAYAKRQRPEARQAPEYEFFTKWVFPESDLPNLAEIVEACDGLFEVVEVQNDRLGYWRTCREWLSRLMARRHEAVALVGEEVFARYVRYLKLSAATFSQVHSVLLRIAFRRMDG